ncbi:MAG: hypothetical protein EHM61_15595 [Acidobacteria bacterium]|nr:MAG: hypothetical protein EHM61_15595 [Acidobacteriota bacterium]
METRRESSAVYALGRVKSGNFFLLTKFDESHRGKTEYVPVFRTLNEAEMELRLTGRRGLNVLSFNSVEDLQRKSPSCPVRYEFDLLLSNGRSGHV